MKSRECLNINDFYRLYINDLDFLYNDSSCGFAAVNILKEKNNDN